VSKLLADQASVPSLFRKSRETAEIQRMIIGRAVTGLDVR
jgi:hypothetical protein